MLLLKNISELKTPVGSAPLKGRAMDDIKTYTNAQIVIENGRIVYAGENSQRFDEKRYRVIDCAGKTVLPGFIDSHTHLVFGGFRAEEFMWRQKGLSYMEIANRGGGIINSVSQTQKASAIELYNTALARIEEIKKMGVTSVEIKSGYGLDEEAELKQLRVIAKLKKKCGIDIKSTYMGAHSIPKEFKGRNLEYLQFIESVMLPKIQKENLADYVDIFCEKGVFTVEESGFLLNKAKEYGFKTKIHADEIESTGGAELAAKTGCVSADHLLQISEKGIKDLASSGTIATLLPLTAFCLKEHYAPARKMIDAGVAVALATDFNPGSCFSYSIPLLIALAVIYMGMTINEVISSLTLNAACALNLQDTTGSIEEGKKADLVILKYPSSDFLAYHTGINCVKNVIKNGKIIV